MMNPINLPETCMTIDALWLALCAAAHDDHDPAGLVVNDDESWSLTGSVSDSDRYVADLFLPILGPLYPHRPMVVGHLAQSLDGCIAQADGESNWISGDEDLDHTHRLRAICDVVLVGAETADRDDCSLSVRRVVGPHPVRVVLDPNGRLSADRKLFHSPGGPTLWLVGDSSGVKSAPHAQVEVVPLSAPAGQFDVQALMDLFHQRGFRRIFIEGGGITISHFLKAGLMDRLHIAMAPILIGGGRPTIAGSLGDSLASCPHPVVQVHTLGSDWLFDCDFRTTSK
jgi:diaminohydroxyphosphoribosylaminopyrimidine deaminase/5-amino-6-(5-phosphoribosylamino)uracil reductase